MIKANLIAGIDEVGKGALFGPVFAGAVVLNTKDEVKLLNYGLRDSKLLTKKKRAFLVPLIKKISLSWGIGQASAQEIDSIGIRSATEHAMVRAIAQLSTKPELLLVDGSLPIRLWNGEQKTLIKGEQKSPKIAAASVLAKEARDELIRALAKKFPNYALETNVGYGTASHCEALKQLGPTNIHRNSFISNIIDTSGN